MLSIKTNDKAKVIEVEIGGKLTAENIQDVKDYFKHKEEQYDVLNTIITVNEMEYSFEGYLEDIRFEKNHVDKFNKVAVVSNEKWVNVISKLVSHVPNIEVENFQLNEREKAFDWVRD